MRNLGDIKEFGGNSYKSPHCEVAMYWDVKTVKPMPDYRIYVEIEDGRKAYLTSNRIWSEEFFGS